ncbi:MAG: ArsR/SmtB family transcription factor [Hydrogenophaga sp.]
MSNPHEPRLARVAALVADPARSRMLAYLLSGEYASAGELARAASVTPATASGHLARLLEARFVVCEARGRHRYYRLANADVAHALEALAVVAERGQHDLAWEHPERVRLRQARCCYGHLAGRLGVQLFASLQGVGGVRAVDNGLALTEAGQAWLARLGMPRPEPTGRRRFAYPCLDWSERRDHLAGQLGDQIFQHLVEREWLRRGEGRTVHITPLGQRDLLPLLPASAPAPAHAEPKKMPRSA